MATQNTVQNENPLIIEVTSDFVCPWCILGHARLDQAVQQVAADVAIEYRWKPYELNPDMPAAGMNRQEYLANKFGADKLQAMDTRMKELGREDGVEFHQELIQKSPNTRLAHRLTWLAEKEGKATEIAHAVFKAYFTEGKDIGDNEVLAALAAAHGMDADKVRSFLKSDEGVKEITALEQEGAKRGIRGVPFITIDSEEIHGAQLVEDMAAAVQRALAVRQAA